MSVEIPFARCVTHRECRGGMEMRGFGVDKNNTTCTVTITMTLVVPQSLFNKGEITETIKSIQRGLVSEEEERHSSQKMEGHTELDLLQHDVN